MNKKRGLSPVIASVLLISLVFVLAAIVFLWARGFLSEQIEKEYGDGTSNIEDVCAKVDYDAEIYKDNGYVITIQNTGDVDVASFSIKQYIGGNAQVKNFKELSLPRGGSISQTIALDKGVEKIELYPVLIGTIVGKSRNTLYTCSDSPYLLDVS